MINNGVVIVTGEGYERFNGEVNGQVEAALTSMAAATVETGLVGKIASSEPSRVEITPFYIDAPRFLVRSFHRLNDFDVSGGLAFHEFSFGLEEVDGETVAQTDEYRRHNLHNDPAIFLDKLGSAAKFASESPLRVS